MGIWRSNKFDLGIGSGGCISRTIWLGIRCAKKVFDQDKGIEKLFLKEVGILAHVNHPRIVKFFCCDNGKWKGQCLIAIELMENSLFNVTKGHKDLHFSLHVVDIMGQMACRMFYLHDNRVAHCNFKPQNVVVNKSETLPHLNVDCFDVKLVDFGM